MSFLVFCSVLAVYLANGRSVGLPGDTLPAQYIPWSVLVEGDLDLDEFTFLHEEGIDWYLAERDGHLFSSYPILPGLMALPAYAAADRLGVLEQEHVWFLAKLTASIFVALSAGFLFSILRRRVGAAWAFALAGGYGLGTGAWVEVSQALWQHGPGLFFLVLALWLLDGAEARPGRAAWAGLALGAAVLARPVHLLSFVLVAVWVAARWPRQLAGFLLLGMAVGAPIVYYNLEVYGNLFGGYASQMGAFTWQGPMGPNALAHLFSPGRGLFLYSPVLALGIAGGGIAWTKWRDDRLPILSVLAVVAYVVLYSRWSLWWGGVSYGNRLLSDSLPYWFLMMVPLIARLRGSAGRALFGVLLAASVAVQAVGAVAFDGRWDILNDSYSHHDRFWSLRDSPLIFTLRQADPRDDRFRRALDDHFNGRAGEAAALMEAYAAGHRPSAGLQYVLGLVRLEEGREEGALGAFREALRLEPGHSGAHEEIGRIFLRQGKVGEAEEWFAKADGLRRANVEMPNASGRSALFCRQDRLGDLIALENRRPNQRINAAYRLGEEPLRFRHGLADRHLVCGWGERSREGRLLVGPITYLRAAFDPAQDVRLLIVAKAEAGEGPAVREVYLDDYRLGLLESGREGWETTELAIPAEAIRPRLQFLRFLPPAASEGGAAAARPILVWSLSAPAAALQ